MLVTMNFPPHLVALIMKCVTMITYSIVINGESGPFFSPARGLRQGDPLPIIYSFFVQRFLVVYWMLPKEIERYMGLKLLDIPHRYTYSLQITIIFS